MMLKFRPFHLYFADTFNNFLEVRTPYICYNINKCFPFAFRWKKQFKQLLEDTGYVTPGKALSEVRVLFMGRECFEALSEMDCQYIYDQHQKEIIEKAKHNFQVSQISPPNVYFV